MNVKNCEFKSKVDDINEYGQQLQQFNPDYKGTDRQVDTYFNTSKGRLIVAVLSKIL